jgi:adenylate cyclase
MAEQAPTERPRQPATTTRFLTAPAHKRAEAGADLLNPQRMLRSLRWLFHPDGTDRWDGPSPSPSTTSTPHDENAEPSGPVAGSDGHGSELAGTAPPLPAHRAGDPTAVDRCFAFVDITGFTEYCDRNGEHAATELLTTFRSTVRTVAARRGVRVAKWLGDGAMLVGVEEAPVVATVAELVMRCVEAGLDTHAGVAAGTVLLFEGDDYIGRPANLAARLCDAAEPGEILAAPLREPLPSWVTVTERVDVEVVGVGRLDDVSVLAAHDEVVRRLTDEPAA